MNIRYGVIGTGYFGAELARALKNCKGAIISAVFDPENGEMIANELSCDNTQSLEALISRQDVDCVIVATPNYLHKEPVLLAAQYKKHVFCEKPIALNYQDCDEMVKTCEKNGVIFMAGHIMNFFNGVHKAKQLINDGVIGKVLYCHTARNGWEDEQPDISWKKIQAKSGGHLYHHIHELDCVQFLMGGMPKTVTMTANNVAHHSEKFGDEDDMIFINMEFHDGRFALLEYGSAFRWGEHYVLIQGEKGAIKLDMYHCAGTLRIDGQESHFLIHESQEEDDDRTRIYTSTEMDGAIQYGKPGKRTPRWLNSIIQKEMSYLHNILSGMKPSTEFEKLLTGEAARAAIATADACKLSRNENRKVQLTEILHQH
ncbi:oxidoreductase [Pasteurellaceae bacterium Macca]|nr:oxidoreductase [Pasteurellaceae bacterium Macca]